ncbi:putative zinc-binding protein [Luedemannella flava]
MTDETAGPGRRRAKDQPLVYSCSGCSSAAQLANALAIRLDRQGVAEMSCIAGLGGDVPSLVRLAHPGGRSWRWTAAYSSASPPRCAGTG